MKMQVLIAALATVGLAGCASGGRCVGEFEYQQAQTIPAIHGAEGIKAPESGSALRIPPPSAQPVAFAEQVPDAGKPGKTKASCLDAPPVMPPLAGESKPDAQVQPADEAPSKP